MKFLFQVCLFVKILQCNEVFLPVLGKVCEQIIEIMMSLTEMFKSFSIMMIKLPKLRIDIHI